MPLVSVILPVFNQEKYLEETIQSILRQSFTDFELLIVDDGSTDDSARIIRRFQQEDNRVFAFFEKNVGKSKATNYLVGKATGKWCVFLDADDVMLPQRIEKQVAFHEANPQIDASSSHCYYINENGNMFGTQRYSGLSTVAQYQQAISREFITCAYTALMVSKKVYIAAGGLNPKYEPCEDFEFFNRLGERGFILLVIPDVLMKYRIHPAAVTVRKPLLVLDTINFVKHCIRRRRSGIPEIGFAAFKKIQDDYSWWTKINQRRFNYSMIYFRSAGFSMLSKNYRAFTLQIMASLVLSPPYVVKKVINHLKK